MAMKCLKCKCVMEGIDGLHLVTKCPNPDCGNTDVRYFIRVDHKDIDPEKKEEERKWLESQRVLKADSKN